MNIFNIAKIKIAIFTCLCGVVHLQAQDLQLGAPFSEHMVLQRKMNVPVWGSAKAGADVAVKVAGKSATAKVASDGQWKLSLPELPAGGPYKMEVKSGKETITYSDVLVGEVWICSGQSNMQMGYGSLKNGKQLRVEADQLPIRSLSVPRMVSMTPQTKISAEWKNDPCSSAVGMTFALDLQKALNVPVGVIEASWGSSSIEGWMPLSFTKKLPHFDQMMKNFYKFDQDKVQQLLEKEKGGKKRVRLDDIFFRTRPNVIYNAMMFPLAPYACRGMVWYQGEANTTSLGSMRQYGESLPMWVQHLRALWKKDDFQFLAVMLPGHGKMVGGGPSKDVKAPDAYSWAWFREAQQKVLTLPHTAVANTIDLGDAKNIHPKDKQPIGHRLSLLAQQQIQPKKVEAFGPVFEKIESVGSGKVRVIFNHSQGLKTDDGQAPRCFWGQNSKGQWIEVKAEIDGSSVILNWDGILTSARAPKAIRYAFSGFPDVNLVNSADLPAMPFRTDQFVPAGYTDQAQEPGAKWRRK